MIVWGNRTRREFAGYLVDSCERCHRLTLLGVLAQQKKFSLYFVPLFTYETKLITFCGSCGGEGTRANSEELLRRLHVDELDALAELQSRIQAKPSLPPPVAAESTERVPQRGPQVPAPPSGRVIRLGQWDVVASTSEAIPPGVKVFLNVQTSTVYLLGVAGTCMLPRDAVEGDSRGGRLRLSCGQQRFELVPVGQHDPDVALAAIRPDLAQPRRAEPTPAERVEVARAPLEAAPAAAAAPSPESTGASSATPGPAGDAKTCPDCAEGVRAAARICRFCRYDFGTRPPAADATGAAA